MSQHLSYLPSSVDNDRLAQTTVSGTQRELNVAICWIPIFPGENCLLGVVDRWETFSGSCKTVAIPIQNKSKVVAFTLYTPSYLYESKVLMTTLSLFESSVVYVPIHIYESKVVYEYNV